MAALKPLVAKISCATALMLASPALAAPTIFVPPSDVSGKVYSTNNEDGYQTGRGVVFAPTSDYLLTSVALYHDLTNILLSYNLRTASATSGYVGGGTLLASGSRTVSTNGLEFISFAMTPTLLVAGTYYHLDFTINGAGNQNFFYDQRGAQPYSQAGFTGIDGTMSRETSNYVLSRIQLNAVSGVPEPATWTMLMLGFVGAGVAMRRRKATNTNPLAA